MEFDVPATIALRGGVGDVLPVIAPTDFVTLRFHQPSEMTGGFRHCHGIIDGNRQPQLPALALVGGTVLSGGHPGGLFLLRLNHGQAVLPAQSIGHIPQMLEGFHVAVVLFSCVHADGIDDEVGVDMLPVGVGGHHHLEALELLCQFQGNLMGCLGRQLLLRVERLDQLIELPSLRFFMEPLGIQELPEGSLRHTVHAGDQSPSLVRSFILPAAVAEGSPQPAGGLGLGTADELNKRHRPTAFVSGSQTADRLPEHTALSTLSNTSPVPGPCWLGSQADSDSGQWLSAA